jgi:hypothetical protein
MEKWYRCFPCNSTSVTLRVMEAERARVRLSMANLPMVFALPKKTRRISPTIGADGADRKEVVVSAQ